jgi:hypothetical protein
MTFRRNVLALSSRLKIVRREVDFVLVFYISSEKALERAISSLFSDPFPSNVKKHMKNLIGLRFLIMPLYIL